MSGKQPERNQNKATEEKSALSESDERDNNTEIKKEQDEISTYSSTDEISALNIPENRRDGNQMVTYLMENILQLHLPTK